MGATPSSIEEQEIDDKAIHNDAVAEGDRAAELAEGTENDGGGGFPREGDEILHTGADDDAVNAKEEEKEQIGTEDAIDTLIGPPRIPLTRCNLARIPVPQHLVLPEEQDELYRNFQLEDSVLFVRCIPISFLLSIATYLFLLGLPLAFYLLLVRAIPFLNQLPGGLGREDENATST